MIDKTIWQGNLPLTQNSIVYFDKLQYDFPLKLTINGNLTVKMLGGCEGMLEKQIFNNNEILINRNSNYIDIPFSLHNKCSQYSGNVHFEITENTLTFAINSNFTGKDFLEYQTYGNIELTKIEYDIPVYKLSYPKTQPGVQYIITRNSSYETDNLGTIVSNPSAAGTATIYKGDSLTISANKVGNHYPPEFGFDSKGIHQIIYVTNNISAVVDAGQEMTCNLDKTGVHKNTNVTVSILKYPAHESFDCDGGCYCYCADGSQVGDGDMCPDIYTSTTVTKFSLDKKIKISARADTGYTLGTFTINNDIYGKPITIERITTAEPIKLSTTLLDPASSMLTTKCAAGTTISVLRNDGMSLHDGTTIFNGDKITVTATSDENISQLKSITINGTTFTDKFTHEITVNGNLTVSTDCTRKYKLSITADTGSSITVERNGQILSENDALYENDTVTVTATVNTGYRLNTFQVTGATSTSGTIRTVTVNGDIFISTSTKQITLITKNIAIGTSVTIYRRTMLAHPSFDCDGGCYCYCTDGSQVGDGDMCPDKYELCTGDIYPGDYLRIIPNISSGYSFGSITVNENTYNSLQTIYVTAGTNLTITTTLAPASWHTITSTSFTLSGYGTLNKNISRLIGNRKLRITVSKGSYSNSIETSSSQPTECDGCYCYCPDGQEVIIGETCYEYRYVTANIQSGTYESNNSGIIIPTLSSNNGTVTNSKIFISANNMLTFTGEIDGGGYKSITITKIEQYY